MGIESGIYIGVYLKIPNSEKEFEETVYTDPVTGKKRITKFNPETGEPNIESTVKNKRKVYPWPDIDELLLDGEEFSGDSDRFWCPQYGPWGDKFSLFMLNISNTKYTIKHDDDDSDCTDLLNRDTDYKKIIADFKIEYKAWLDIYEREYGEIYIGYGVITYSN